MTFYLKKTHEAAIEPTTRSGSDVGHDLYTIESVKLYKGVVTKVRTGLTQVNAEGHSPSFLKIEGRSSLAARGIFPVGGIIDPSYRGEIIALFMNMSGETVEFPQGVKFAQLIPYRVHAIGDGIKIVSDAPTRTVRGAGGFGSTDG